MHTETAFIKLGWVLSQTTKPDEVKKMMLTNYAGEFNDRFELIFSNSISAVEDIKSKHFVKVYPNPTQGSIYIDTDLTKTENMTISVYNSLGARVYYGQYTAVNQNQYQIDLPEQAGVYIVKLETTTQSHTQQVVLVR